MWKIENWGPGALAVLLASASAVGQEWPQVIHRERGVQGGAWRVVVRQGADGVFVFTKSSQPLMEGELKSTVEELEVAVEIAVGSDPAAGLAALDTVTRATMKARRQLVPLEKAGPKPEREAQTDKGTPVVSPDGRWIAFSRDGERIIFLTDGDLRDTGPELTPLQKTQQALQSSSTSLRHATDFAEARKALEDLDRDAAALRQLLWKKKSGKRD